MKLPLIYRFAQKVDATASGTDISDEAPADEGRGAERSWRPPRDVIAGVVGGLALACVLSLAIVPKRKSSACFANQRLIVMGIKLYVRDYDEKFPNVYADNDRSGRFDSISDIGWTQSLEPYIKAPLLFQCPTEPTLSDLRRGAHPGYTDYFFNKNLDGISESNLGFVSNTICTGDGAAGNAAMALNGCASNITCREPLNTLATLPAAQRHLAGANYTFADGHVKWLAGASNSHSPAIFSATTPASAATISFAP